MLSLKQPVFTYEYLKKEHVIVRSINNNVAALTLVAIQTISSMFPKNVTKLIYLLIHCIKQLLQQFWHILET